MFLAANPIRTDRISLDREARGVQLELERSGYRDHFELLTRWAAEPIDLLRGLRKLQPTVVHFSGHGGRPQARMMLSGKTADRDIAVDMLSNVSDPEYGLFFQGSNGHIQLVSAAALEATFDAAGKSVKLAVLSACYSELLANALLAHVGCVIGMSGSIGDEAARSFAIGFYGGLGDGESVAVAYKQGCAAIRLDGVRSGDRPLLRVRRGTDAAQVFLVER